MEISKVIKRRSFGRSLFAGGHDNATKHPAREGMAACCVAAAIKQCDNIEAAKATRQCGVRQGLKVFRKEGAAAVLKEMKQFHGQTVASPLDPKTVTKEIRDKALPCLMFLKRKRCGTVKG